MNDDRPVFGALEVIEITSKFEKDDDAFLIGGQATNFWAWFYQDKEEELKLKGPFTSEDIDYFGTKEVAATVADALGAKLYLPKPEDHTASTAQIVTTINGKLLKIDFLNSVLGVRNRELRNGVSVLDVSADLGGVPATVRIKVLHPMVCLKSRLVSMLHPATRRSDKIARTQAEAALVIARRFIDDALSDPAGWKDARDCLRQTYLYLRYDEYVKSADSKLEVDPLSILHKFANDERIDQRYRNMQIKKWIADIERRRAGREEFKAQATQ